MSRQGGGDDTTLDLEAALHAYVSEEEKQSDALLTPPDTEASPRLTHWQRLCQPHHRRWVIFSLLCAALVIAVLLILLVPR